MTARHSYLVTGPADRRQLMAFLTGALANWLDAREQTSLVTCMDKDSAGFLQAARDLGLTVEEIERDSDGREVYRLVVGEPGTGWAAAAGLASEAVHEELPEPDLSFGWRDYTTTHNPFHHGQGHESLDVQESDEPVLGEERCAKCREKPGHIRLFRVGADDIARDCWFFCDGCFGAMVRSGEVKLHVQ